MDESPGGYMQEPVTMPLSFWFYAGKRDRRKGFPYGAGSTRWTARLAYVLGWWRGGMT